MTFWDTFHEKHAWGISLLLKSGVLGLGIVIVLWGGWPQPPISLLDDSSAPIELSDNKSIQAVHRESTLVTINSLNVSLQSSSVERKKPDIHAAQIPLLVDLNVSSQIELKALPGIGMILADRIVSYRSTYGRFQRVGDLVKVSGIGEKRLKRLEPFVTVEMIGKEVGS